MRELTIESQPARWAREALCKVLHAQRAHMCEPGLRQAIRDARKATAARQLHVTVWQRVVRGLMMDLFRDIRAAEQAAWSPRILLLHSRGAAYPGCWLTVACSWCFRYWTSTRKRTGCGYCRDLHDLVSIARWNREFCDLRWLTLQGDTQALLPVLDWLEENGIPIANAASVRAFVDRVCQASKE